MGGGRFIGFVIGILVLVLILRVVFFGAFAHRHGSRGYGHGHWGNTGPGDWQRGPWSDPRRAMFDEFHRRAHDPASQPSKPNQPNQPGQPSDPTQPGGR